MLDSHAGINYLGVDFDPGIINEWKDKGRDIIYGDMEDPELLEQVPYNNNGIIISTITNNEHSRQLIKILKSKHYQGKVFVTASTEIEHQQLREYGVDDENILRPHQMAAANFYQTFLKSK